ncbi:MAG: TlpA family protein disulfide reductase [Planctomycetes bacterium]|nr:TlpA family protein disulfide reductase [Planctomycetota bacterium]
MKFLRAIFGNKAPEREEAEVVKSEIVKLGRVAFVNSVVELNTWVAGRGKARVVNHWATWCEPCVAELEYLAAMHAKFGARVDFVGISWERFTDARDEAEVRAAIENVYNTFKLTYDTAVAPADAEAVLFGLGLKERVIPQTYVYDGAGNCIFYHCGGVEDGEARERFERSLFVVTGGA